MFRGSGKGRAFPLPDHAAAPERPSWAAAHRQLGGDAAAAPRVVRARLTYAARPGAGDSPPQPSQTSSWCTICRRQHTPGTGSAAGGGQRY